MLCDNECQSNPAKHFKKWCCLKRCFIFSNVVVTSSLKCFRSKNFIKPTHSNLLCLKLWIFDTIPHLRNYQDNIAFGQQHHNRHLKLDMVMSDKRMKYFGLEMEEVVLIDLGCSECRHYQKTLTAHVPDSGRQSMLIGDLWPPAPASHTGAETWCSPTQPTLLRSILQRAKPNPSLARLRKARIFYKAGR